MVTKETTIMRAAAHLEGAPFREAKTYALTAPHQYFIRNEAPYTFRLMEDLIEKFGYVAWFWGRPYRYVDIGDYQYWIIGEVCNRAIKVNHEGQRQEDH